MELRNYPRRARLGALSILAGLLVSSAWHSGRAADPQPYDITIEPTGDATIDQGVKASATLVSLRDTAPVGGFALLARARADAVRFVTVLNSQGYYDGTVTITVAGHKWDDPALPELLDATPQGTSVPVVVSMTTGPLYRIGKIELTGNVPPAAQAAFGLQPGAPARAADVLAARDSLLANLHNSGYALAKVAEPEALLRPPTQTLDIVIAVDAGPAVALGPIAISGLEQTNEAFIVNRLLLHQGDQFSTDKIEAARQDLASLGIFSSVRIEPATALDAQGQLPLQVTVVERPLHSVNLGASYSTDLGAAATASWTHHNLWGNGEQLTLSAAAEDFGGTAAINPGYRLSADLLFPDWRQRDQTLDLNVLGIDETLQAYSRRAVIGAATVTRKLDPDWNVSIGLQLEEAYIVQNGTGRDYTLLQLPTAVAYDTTHASLDPANGLRAKLSLVPSQSLLNGGTTFVIAQAAASTYLDVGALLFGTTGRSVLAARALAGSVAGASTFDIPPDQRFYAGGGGSVRGFRFQSLGPQFGKNEPVGGTAVDTFSLEWRQRIGETYGAVAFVDAGQIGSNSIPFQGQVHVGAGVGVRYYTAFGPLRLDFAVPVNRLPGGDIFEVYIGLGQAF